MSKLTAKQIVASLLEYGIDPNAPRPGSPDDPWRQTTGPLPKMKFTAKRPDLPVDDDEGGEDEGDEASEFWQVELTPEQEQQLERIHQQFVNERIRGFIHPETKEAMPPVSPEEAEERWLKVRDRFREVLSKREPPQQPSRFQWRPPE